jgi:hypothetical protein
VRSWTDLTERFVTDHWTTSFWKQCRRGKSRLIWDQILLVVCLSLVVGKIVLVASIPHFITQQARHLSRTRFQEVRFLSLSFFVFLCLTLLLICLFLSLSLFLVLFGSALTRALHAHSGHALVAFGTSRHRHYYQYQPAAVALFLCALMSISSALFGSGRVRSSSEFVFCFDPEIWNLKVLDLGAIFGNAQNCVWFFLFVYFRIRLCVVCVGGRGESGQGAAFVFWEAADRLTARHSSRVLLILLPLSCAPVVVFQASQCPGCHHQVCLPTPLKVRVFLHLLHYRCKIFHFFFPEHVWLLSPPMPCELHMFKIHDNLQPCALKMLCECLLPR